MALTPGTPVTPLRQPPAEDLRNAAAIASAARQWLERPGKDPEEWLSDFARIEELIGSALGKLAEPHPIVIERAVTLLRAAGPEAFGGDRKAESRHARDLAAVTMTAALEWR